MVQANLIVTHPPIHEKEPSSRRMGSALVDNIFQKLSGLELLGKDQIVSYLRYRLRRNHKPKSISGSYKSIEIFLSFCARQGKARLDEITREDLEGFVEHEQDRGTQITSIAARLRHVSAFLRYLIDEELLSEKVLRRKVKLLLPDVLPRAINIDDIRQFFSVIKTPRDRALCLLLLRTGMRIGELINLKVTDLDIRDKKVHIYEGEKNCLGRVVYLSEDALFALIIWLSKRDSRQEFLFYGYGNNKPLSYSTARNIFVNGLEEAGLQNRGYTLHCLRHTLATDILNAGMRLECLQELLGHQSIEMTRRYARLTNKSREEEYFRAMAIIEQGGFNANR